MAEVSFPSNSEKKQAEPRQRPKKVISEGVGQKELTTMDKAVLAFKNGDDSQSVASFILLDVLIPAFKNMLADAGSQGIERLLFGSRRSVPERTVYSPRYTDYQNPYRSQGASRFEPPRQTRRSSNNVADFVLKTRDDADRVLEGLSLLIEQYGTASVADFNDLVGIEGTYTDNKWGWSNLRDASIDRVREGWCIRIPSPEPI